MPFGKTEAIGGRFRAAMGAVVVDDIRVTEVRGDGGIASDEGEFDREGDLNGCMNDTEGRLDMPSPVPRRDAFEPCTDRRFMYGWSAGELLNEVPLRW